MINQEQMRDEWLSKQTLLKSDIHRLSLQLCHPKLDSGSSHIATLDSDSRAGTI